MLIALAWFLALAILATFVLGSFLSEPSSPKVPKVERKPSGLQGPVKSVAIEEVLVDTAGDESRHTRSERVVYDRDGKCIRIERDTIRSQDQMHWNSDSSAGNITTQIPNPLSAYGFRLILPEWEGEDRVRVLYRYPIYPHQSERFIYESDGSLKRRYVHSQSPVGRYVTWTRYTAEGRLDGRDITIYNERGDYLLKKRYGPDGDFELHWTYKYDDRGNLLEMTSLDEEGVPKQKIVYVYTYDEWGNWTERTTLRFGSAGDMESTFLPKIVTRRTISYY